MKSISKRPPVQLVFANLRHRIHKVKPSKHRRQSDDPELWEKKYEDMTVAFEDFASEFGHLRDGSESFTYWMTQFERFENFYSKFNKKSHETKLKEWQELGPITGAFVIQDGVRTIKPESLIERMRLAAFDDVQNGMVIGSCEHCAKIMVIGRAAGGYRTDAQFCSSSCKSIVLRRRALRKGKR